MKILLQDKKTGLYYARRNDWTPEPGEAHDLAAKELIGDFASEPRLREAAPVYYFEDSLVSLPVQDSQLDVRSKTFRPWGNGPGPFYFPRPAASCAFPARGNAAGLPGHFHRRAS
jgi:hypothetical protein